MEHLIHLLNYFPCKVNPIGQDLIAFSKFCYFLIMILNLICTDVFVKFHLTSHISSKLGQGLIINFIYILHYNTNHSITKLRIQSIITLRGDFSV